MSSWRHTPFRKNKPYETKLPENFTIQVNDYPRLSGCMTLSNGQLVGIDQQGNYMSSISQSDCKKYMNGYRPFDYSAQTSQRQNPPPSTISQNNQQSQTSEVSL